MKHTATDLLNALTQAVEKLVRRQFDTDSPTDECRRSVNIFRRFARRRILRAMAAVDSRARFHGYEAARRLSTAQRRANGLNVDF